MVDRTSLTRTNTTARTGLSRATVRSVSDKHLMQQVEKADVFHSETPSDFERFQMVGITAVPLPQEEDEQQSQNQNHQGASGKDDGMNHNQPKGKSAEALMLYLNGQRSHPVALIDDRRVRPYAMKPGESAMYAASGTGQMLFHNNAGSYLVAVNNPPEQSKENEETERFASLRHVEKQKQKREIKEGEEVEEHKHEGESVNMEVRATKTRIEFRAGDDVVGYYEDGKWVFIGEIKLGSEDADHPVYGKNTDSGFGQITESSGAGAVLIKAPNPGPPTSEDTAP